MSRSVCPKCSSPMTLAQVKAGPIGFEHQSFKCRSCDHAEEVVVVLDPMDPSTLGWLDGELGAPPKNLNAVTYTIDRGRLISHPATKGGN